MSAVEQSPVARTDAPTFARLVKTEFARLWWRRFTRVTLVVCAVGFLIAIGVVWATHSTVTPADIAQATAQRDAEIAQIKAQAQQCQAQNPDATGAECGFVPTPDQFPIDQFLHHHPFQPSMVDSYALAVAVACAMAAFLLAATFIGAEWSSKNLVAWLYYEPRRLRLAAAKLLALCGMLLPLAILAQLVWWLAAKLLIAYRGVPVSTLGAQAAHFWSDLGGTQIRAALLVIPVALIGFALANLIRNTAASLGVAFVYLAVVESLARSFSPGSQPYLFTNGVAAWITQGGITVFGRPVFNQQQGVVMPQAVHLSNLHGAIVLIVYTAVLLGISLALFRRRDIT